MMNMVEKIKAELRTNLAEYRIVYAERMYYEAQYNFAVTEEQRTRAARHSSLLAREARKIISDVLDYIYWDYENTEFEAAYDVAEEDFDNIIIEVQKEACDKAEQMRQINGVKLDPRAYIKD